MNKYKKKWGLDQHAKQPLEEIVEGAEIIRYQERDKHNKRSHGYDGWSLWPDHFLHFCDCKANVIHGRDKFEYIKNPWGVTSTVG